MQSTLCQLVYGGRDDKDYFGDLWLLDIAAGEWRQLQPQGPRAPPRRDHHGAAYFRGRLFIHGGRLLASGGVPEGIDEGVAASQVLRMPLTRLGL